MPYANTLKHRTRVLKSEASIGALLLASFVLFSTAAMADPSITYTGKVTPPPAAGTTDWDWPYQVLTVGDNAAGTLDIRGGATISGDTMYIGDHNGSKKPASVVVDGKGSAITTTHINLGNGGTGDDGTLTISNGAHVVSNSNDTASIMVGAAKGATGHLIVSGQGSSLISNNVIMLGLRGTGDMTITDGGQVTGKQLYLGNDSNSVGTATISGAGSAWNGQFGIWVGQFGKGTLNLFDGGAINDSSLQIAYDTGTTGTVNIGGAANAAAQASGILNVDKIVFNRNGGDGAGTLNFNTTDGTSVRAAISGNGTINQIAGNTVFTGDNSGFTGTMAITGGSLQLGDGGQSGNLAVDVSTGKDQTHKGILAFNRSDDVTFSNVISGTGALIQQGNGTTILTADNTYAGGTTILAGTLQLGKGGATGSIVDSNISNNGALAFAHSNNIAFNSIISGSGKVVQRGDAILTLAGDNSFNGGLTVEKGIAKAGITDHAFGSGLLSVNAGAKADLANFNTTVGGLAGAGNVAMGSGNLSLISSFDTLFSGVIDGSGALSKTGEGTQTLSGANSYSGTTIVSGGTLAQGAQGAFNATSSGFNVDKEGTLDLGGFDTSLAALSNSGHVKFGGNGGTTLNVAGNYVGSNGELTITTVLGGDNSKTDKLNVSGDTSGTTKLYVTNAGGTGAQTVNGIKIVDIAGKSDGVFSLANSYTTKDGQQAVVGGAYAYTLQQGSTNSPKDGDWYLSSHVGNPNSPNDPTNPTDPTNPDNPVNPDQPVTPPTPRYSAGVPVYEGYAQNMLALNKLPTLQQRVGGRYLTTENGHESNNGAAVDKQGIWARVEGAHNRLEPETSTSRMKQDINTLSMQAGVDGQFYEGESGKLIAGITGQYGHAKGDVSSFHGDGDISTDAWSLGTTATWYGNNGFYVDGQAQVSWFDNDLNSSTANRGLADGSKATGYAMSVEAGQRFAVNQSWALTPQAQLMWSSIDADSFHDSWGSRVSLHDANSLTGRVGLAANYRNDWKGSDGLPVNTNIYGIANLYQQFLGGTTVNVAGVDFNTENDKTWGGIGAGGSYAWADAKYAIYGEGSVNTSLNNFANSYALKGTVGFKAKW